VRRQPNVTSALFLCLEERIHAQISRYALKFILLGLLDFLSRLAEQLVELLE